MLIGVIACVVFLARCQQWMMHDGRDVWYENLIRAGLLIIIVLFASSSTLHFELIGMQLEA